MNNDTIHNVMRPNRYMLGAFLASIGIGCANDVYPTGEVVKQQLSDVGAEKIEIKETYEGDVELPLTAGWKSVRDLTFTGDLQLKRSDSLVRVILVDSDSTERLVYETYPILAPKKSFKVTNACDETCSLDDVNPASIRLEIVHASVSEIAFAHGVDPQVKSAQSAETKLRTIRDKIRLERRPWKAGETSISKMSYAEKKKLFGDKVPNLQGWEFYKSGVFTKPSANAPSGASSASAAQSALSSGLNDTSAVPSRFDWRKIHGADDPTSSYYDGDVEGSGWLTSVKTQNCNHCWAFSAVGTAETLANLYFNDHMDLDLSEQDVGSCSGGETSACGGGYTWRASGGSSIRYFIEEGAVNESCFPYYGQSRSCSDRCSNPEERILIAGRSGIVNTEQDLKRAIVQYGPVSACYKPEAADMGHCVVVFGYDLHPYSGETIWKYKNSYGPEAPGRGWEEIIVPVSDLDGENDTGLNIMHTPITSLYHSYSIACVDRDGDGYFNWGISNDKPSSCPATSPATKDCDDANPAYYLANSKGHCLKSCTNNFECDDQQRCSADVCNSSHACEHTAIPDCGDCLSFTASVAEHAAEAARRVYIGEEQEKDCSQCFLRRCPTLASSCIVYKDKYYARGSDEYLGTDPAAIVTLRARENSYVWSSNACTASVDPCQSDATCGNGQYCDGIETCVNGACQPGTPPCNDHIDCTSDQCNEASDSCAYTPNDSLCNDSNECTQDQCGSLSGCEYTAIANCPSCLANGSRCTSNIECCSNSCSRLTRRCR